MVIKESDIRKIQSLFAACMVGDLNGVITILNAHWHDIDGNNKFAIDIDPKGYARRPIHAATIGGHINIVKFLIENGADVNIQNRYGDTALHFAVHHNRSFILTELLKSKADPTIKNHVFKTPIDIAEDQKKLNYVEEMKSYIQLEDEPQKESVLKKLLDGKQP